MLIQKVIMDNASLIMIGTLNEKLVFKDEEKDLNEFIK